MKINFKKSTITLLSILLASCTAKHAEEPSAPKEPEGPAISIIAKPLFLKKADYKKPKNPGKHQAYTEWAFHCYPDLYYVVQKTDQERAVYTTTILVKKVRLTTSLPITIRMPVKVTLATMDHEQGHLQICSEVYKTGETAAYDAAQAVIDKLFTGKANTESGALNDAINQAKMQIGDIYKHKVVDQAQVVSEKYDDLTEHGTSVKEAIKQAFEAYRKSVKPAEANQGPTDSAASDDSKSTPDQVKSEESATSNDVGSKEASVSSDTKTK